MLDFIGKGTAELKGGETSEKLKYENMIHKKSNWKQFLKINSFFKKNEFRKSNYFTELYTFNF